MADRSDQVLRRTEMIPALMVRLRNAEGLIANLKEEMKDAKAEREEALGEIISINREIADLHSGQGLLEFDEHPDMDAETPLLNAMAELLRTANEQNAKSLDTPLAVMVAYDVSEKSITSIQNAHNVHTVRGLAEAIANDDEWFQLCEGIGKKKAKDIEEAVAKAIAEKHPLHSAGDDDEDGHDLRQRRCTDCGTFRDQSVAKCTCGSTLFELEWPKQNELEVAETPSRFAAQFVDSLEVPDYPGLYAHSIQNPDHGMWHSCFQISIDDLEVGMAVPHHESEAFDSQEDAWKSALAAMARELSMRACDDEAIAVRDYSREHFASVGA